MFVRFILGQLRKNKGDDFKGVDSVTIQNTVQCLIKSNMELVSHPRRMNIFAEICESVARQVQITQAEHREFRQTQSRSKPSVHQCNSRTCPKIGVPFTGNSCAATAAAIERLEDEAWKNYQPEPPAEPLLKTSLETGTNQLTFFPTLA